MRDPADNLPDDLRLHQALRDGLRALPVPPVASDFDARILDALRAPVPWWQCLWEPARPLLLGASCSLLVTLALLHWTLSASVGTPRPLPPLAGGGQENVQAAAPPRAPSLDSLLDRPDLRAGSLAAWTLPPPAPPDRLPQPPRHAQAGRRSCLVV